MYIMKIIYYLCDQSYKRLKKINLNILCVDLLFMIYIVRQFSYCK